jgi:hypothetical protein
VQFQWLSSGIVPSLKLCTETTRRNPGSSDFTQLFDAFRIWFSLRQRREICSPRRELQGGVDSSTRRRRPPTDHRGAVALPPLRRPARLAEIPPATSSLELSLSNIFLCWEKMRENGGKMVFIRGCFLPGMDTGCPLVRPRNRPTIWFLVTDHYFSKGIIQGIDKHHLIV